MDNKEINNIINELIESDGAVNIPGLSADEVVPTLVDKKHAKELQGIQNPKDREDKRNELIDYYKNDAGREMVDGEINTIKMNFSALKSQLESVKKSVQSTISQAAVPAVITVGSASSSPNPAYSVLDAKSKRDNLLALLKTASIAAAAMLISSQKLGFSIPQEVVALITLLSQTKKTVKTLGG